DENLAAEFNSALLSTHTIMLFFSLRYIFPKGYLANFPYNIILNSTMASVFVIWYFLCKKYFIKKKNYIRIINKYEEKYPDKKIEMALIGIAYSLFTFLSFYITAVYLANGTFW